MQLTVNDTTYEVADRPVRPLLQVLQDELGISGVGSNCLQGHCGSCTVQIDGEAVRACITPVGHVAGAAIQTAAGLSPTHILAQAFARHRLNSCDGCPAGQLMAAKAFLDKHPDASAADVHAALANHLCDCLRYRDLHHAIADAVEAKREASWAADLRVTNHATQASFRSRKNP